MITNTLCALRVWILLLAFATTAFANSLFAQSETSEKKWHYLTDIYLMFPYLNGETGVNDILVPIDATPSDVFSKLKIGGMLYLEASTTKWAITSDLLFMNLNQDVTTGKLWHSGDVTAKQLFWEAAGLYRINSFWEVGLGGRLNSIEASIDARRNVLPAGTVEVSGSETETWYDPLVITRLATTVKNKWLFQFRGDVGGFGIGSNLSWQLQAYAGYKFNKVFQMTAGYRYLSLDYDKGVDEGTFVFNTDEFGPMIRFGFNF